MIDSVVLQLNSDQFIIKDRNRFDGLKSHGNKGYTAGSYYSSSYAKNWKKKGVYCPLFSLKNGCSGKEELKEILEIQFSLSKIIYGTNAFEIDIYNLSDICEQLLFFLKGLGIETTKESLLNAIVRRVDFSKIIIIPPYLGMANKVIKSLSGFDYKPQSHFEKQTFGDSQYGTSMKFLNSTQGFVIYDKIYEIIKNGYTTQEKWLVESYNKGDIKRNLIKIELSLQRKDSLEAVLNRRILNKKKDFTLEEIISNKEACKAILLDSFNKVINPISTGLITLSEMEDNKLLDYLYSSVLTQHQREKLYFWVRIATNFGIAGLWDKLKDVYAGGNVSEVKKKISQALVELGPLDRNLPNLVEFIRTELEKFEMVKPKTDKFFVKHC